MTEDYSDRDKWPDELLIKKWAVHYINWIDEASDAKLSKKLQSEILRRMREPEWISVDERLPVLGDLVLCYDAGSSKWKWGVFSSQKIDGDLWWFLDDIPVDAPTHWQPLSEPPLDKE